MVQDESIIAHLPSIRRHHFLAADAPVRHRFEDATALRTRQAFQLVPGRAGELLGLAAGIGQRLRPFQSQQHTPPQTRLSVTDRRAEGFRLSCRKAVQAVNHR
ncbi:MAG: hypothetical protein U0792_09495 [Gemmataceae bacterium]